MKDSGLSSTKIREPAFAGRFYPSSGKKLLKQLVELFSHAKQPVNMKQPQALLAPHAGYVFSGQVAASAYNQLPEKCTYKRVFVLASSHQFTFSGASVNISARYKTPVGEIKVDRRLARKLIDTDMLIRFIPEAHLYEHSLEVQLPFLQHKLGTDFLLVPIILGTHNVSECEKIALLLEPWFTPENLFVISTDFSHYPAYEDAVENDFRTAQAICSNNPDILMKSLEQDKNIKNLATSLCGWASVMTLLSITQHKNVEYRLIHYQNSGDSKVLKDKTNVVGYWAMAVYNKNDSLSVSPNIQHELLEKARQAILHYIKTGEMIHPAPVVDEFFNPAGMFVSIYVNGELRGCIGNVTNNNTLNEAVQQLAIAASCDERFDSIQMEELNKLEVEISLLSPLRQITSIDEIILGKHGIYIKKGSDSGTFLPKVPLKTGWTLKEFLGHCSQDKAGIGWDGWKDAEIFVYETFIFRG